MATVAEQLRAAREAKKIPISEVAQITKMRADHVVALEEGNFNVFVAPVYIRGFVRTYSTLLKLDVEQVMKSLEAELGQTEKFSEPPPLTDDKGAVDFVTLQLSKVNWRTGGIFLGAVAVIALIVWGIMLWKNHRPADPSKTLPPARYQSPARNSDNTLPLTPQSPRK